MDTNLHLPLTRGSSVQDNSGLMTKNEIATNVTASGAVSMIGSKPLEMFWAKKPMSTL
jgi:NADH:ubiquinone oxidoreductase subunit 5 (subunit L)/multisubunit Na+/H+ antiporter MnhA subunit